MCYPASGWLKVPFAMGSICGRNTLARLDPFGVPVIPPEVHKTRLGGVLQLLCWAVLGVYVAFVVTEYVHPVIHTDTSYIVSDNFSMNRAILAGTGAFERLVPFFSPYREVTIPTPCSNAANASELDSGDIICSTAYESSFCPISESSATLYPGPSFAFAANSSTQLSSSGLEVIPA